MKVLVLGLNYAPEPSGIAPYTSAVAAGLASRGHLVRVVTAHPHYPQWRVKEGHGGWSTRHVLDGVEVRRVSHYVPRRPTGVRRAASEATFGARSTASTWTGADVVVTVSPALISSAMAIARGRMARRGPALGLVLHDLYSAGVAETGAGGQAVTRTLTDLEAWTVRNADGTAVIHERFKQRLTSSFGVPADRLTVIRNWTHVAPVPAFNREKLRHDFGWGRSTVVLHAGAMGEKQALGNVVEAARVAEGSGRNVLFVLLGDGGQRLALERQAAGLRSVRFVDPLPGALYGQAMRAADVLLVNEKPGVSEMAVPSKLTSYFSTGVPVLAATEVGSTTAEEIAAAGAGVRTDPGRPDGLLQAVERLVDDRERAARIGARGPEYCARVLSEEAAIDGYEAWIHELVKRAAQRRGKR